MTLSAGYNEAKRWLTQAKKHKSARLRITRLLRHAGCDGSTKHVGGWTATQEFAQLCNLQEGQEILYVGCGAGTAATTIAMEYKCRLVGVDLLDAMVESAREWAQR